MDCNCCDKHISPIHRIGNEYFYRVCDTCLENVGECCSDVDDNGICECINCMQAEIARAGIYRAL